VAPCLLRVDRGGGIPGQPSAAAGIPRSCGSGPSIASNPTSVTCYAAKPALVPPEQLLLASLLQAFYGIRSERLLFGGSSHNLLFRAISLVCRP